jgi:RsiW-degrading membrane proteinase PrsW (M82 family)
MIPAAVVAFLIECVAFVTPTIFRPLPFSQGWLRGYFEVTVLIGPAVEEALKITPLAWIVWKSPGRVRSTASLLTAAFLCGGAFGALENLAVLNVHFPDIPPALLSAVLRWRWSVCLPLHAVCSLIAGVGLVSAWRLGRKGQPGKGWSMALFFYLDAVAVHAIYNFSTIFLGIL